MSEEARRQMLEKAERRLSVRFPVAFRDAYVSGVELPNRATPDTWSHIFEAQWPGAEPPAGVAFPEDGDPDFYCLIEEAPGALCEVLHYWSHETREYEVVAPHLGAEEGTWLVTGLRAASPLFAQSAADEEEQPDWASHVADALLDRELVEVRAINRGAVAAVIRAARTWRPSLGRELSDEALAARIVEAMEEEDTIEDFFFDDAGLVDLLAEFPRNAQ